MDQNITTYQTSKGDTLTITTTTEVLTLLDEKPPFNADREIDELVSDLSSAFTLPASEEFIRRTAQLYYDQLEVECDDLDLRVRKAVLDGIKDIQGEASIRRQSIAEMVENLYDLTPDWWLVCLKALAEVYYTDQIGTPLEKAEKAIALAHEKMPKLDG